MRVLLIGAGAVGQVYGYHFQQGGAEVAFVVRPKYEAQVRQGFDLYPLNRKRPREAPVRFDGFGVFSDQAEALANGPWDAVVLCLSSTALRKGTWLAELAAGLGDATLLTLTPGIEDHALITELVPPSQVIGGLIGLSSYPGPLPGASLPTPGMAYWLPPRTKMAFSGPSERVSPVVDVLNAGGLPSKVVDDVKVSAAFAGPVLQFQIIALELVGWTFAGLRADKELMALTHRATREAFLVAEKHLNVKTPRSLRMLRPWQLRTVTRLAPRVAPFDMERFFEKHFGKVGDQTEQGIATLIRLAGDYGVDHSNMSELASRLVTARAGDAPAVGAQS